MNEQRLIPCSLGLVVVAGMGMAAAFALHYPTTPDAWAAWASGASAYGTLATAIVAVWVVFRQSNELKRQDDLKAKMLTTLIQSESESLLHRLFAAEKLLREIDPNDFGTGVGRLGAWGARTLLDQPALLVTETHIGSLTVLGLERAKAIALVLGLLPELRQRMDDATTAVGKAKAPPPISTYIQAGVRDALTLIGSMIPAIRLGLTLTDDQFKAIKSRPTPVVNLPRDISDELLRNAGVRPIPVPE